MSRKTERVSLLMIRVGWLTLGSKTISVGIVVIATAQLGSSSCPAMALIMVDFPAFIGATIAIFN